MSREAMQHAQDALFVAREFTELYDTEHAAWVNEKCHEAIAALRAALAEPEPRNQCAETCERAKLCATCARGIDGAEQKKPMPITDDYGQALLPHYRVIEQRGQWRLLYDQMVVGEKVRHEFRIVKIPHDILLYPGISLEEAKRRFDEVVENDYE